MSLTIYDKYECFNKTEKWLDFLYSLDGMGEIGGVSIENCDNPGWVVKIDLNNTIFTKYTFDPLKININSNGVPELKHHWLSCYIENGVYHGAGDPAKLEIILNTFFDWAIKNGFDLEYDYMASYLNSIGYQYMHYSGYDPSQRKI